MGWLRRRRNRDAYQAAFDVWWIIRLARQNKEFEMALREQGADDADIQQYVRVVDLSPSLEHARRDLGILRERESQLETAWRETWVY